MFGLLTTRELTHSLARGIPRGCPIWTCAGQGHDILMR